MNRNPIKECIVDLDKIKGIEMSKSDLIVLI